MVQDRTTANCRRVSALCHRITGEGCCCCSAAPQILSPVVAHNRKAAFYVQLHGVCSTAQCLLRCRQHDLLMQIPIAKGVPRKGAAEFGSPLTFLTPTLEVNVGRVAMLVRLLYGWL